MAFTPALIGVIVVLVLLIAIALALILRKGWFHWDTLKPEMLVDSLLVPANILMIIRIMYFVYGLFNLVFAYIYANGNRYARKLLCMCVSPRTCY